MDLFPEITDRSSRFDFESPNGLLFATQFAQIALVLVLFDFVAERCILS